MFNLPSFFYKIEDNDENNISGFVYSEEDKYKLIEHLENETGFTFICQ